MCLVLGGIGVVGAAEEAAWSALTSNGPALAMRLAPVLGVGLPMAEGGSQAARLLANAAQQFKNGQFTAAGRALTKHPNIIGLSGNILQQLGGAANVNAAAAAALQNIVANGTMTTKNTAAFGQVIQYTLSSGLGARWEAASGTFIGFLGRGL